MQIKNHKATIIKFNECINNKNIEGLANLMHDEYLFIDSAGNSEQGKQKGINSWKGFFNHFPDYKNVFTNTIKKDNLVIITGHSKCSNKLLDGPAIWTAKIEDNKIIEWRVYDDTKENRTKLGI